jgi:hypothetical protein
MSSGVSEIFVAGRDSIMAEFGSNLCDIAMD